MIKKSENKRAQMNLSFGMIFSIILIIIFIVFAIYVIIKFLELQDTLKIEQFLKDFQNDIDTMWKSPQGSREVSYSLSAKITSVCFSDDEFQNLGFTSENIIPGRNINNLNIEKIIEDKNPFCIENEKGKLKLIISKNYGEMLVTVEKNNEL